MSNISMKLFVGESAENVEQEVNIWLANTSEVEIIKTEATVSLIPMPPNVGARAPIEERFTLNIWYRPIPVTT
jgi:hypothetical protein